MWFRLTVLIISLAIGLLSMTDITLAAPGAAVQKRIDADLAAGRPIVVHVVVALCDNAHQGIVPVPPALGNGQNPDTNLYWGAAYGFRTHLIRRCGFKRLATSDHPEPGVLQRIVLYKTIERSGIPRPVIVIGEAWDGSKMKRAVNRFLSLAAGGSRKTETINLDARRITFESGGASAMVAFVGHNGLMDFTLDVEPAQTGDAPPKNTVVLACASKGYFLDVLRRGGSQPLILTTGLMAPEAYTLNAIVHEFARGAAPARIRDAAAAAYHRYQKCGLAAAKKLFYLVTHAQR